MDISTPMPFEGEPMECHQTKQGGADCLNGVMDGVTEGVDTVVQRGIDWMESDF
jgi:hypothetical protein